MGEKMFKNFYCVTQKNKQIQLIKLNVGFEVVILTIQISGGSQDGKLIINKYDGNTLAFKQKLNIAKEQPIALNHKILLPQNYTMTVQSDVDGIMICANVVYSALNEYINGIEYQSSNSSSSDSSI